MIAYLAAGGLVQGDVLALLSDQRSNRHHKPALGLLPQRAHHLPIEAKPDQGGSDRSRRSWRRRPAVSASVSSSRLDVLAGATLNPKPNMFPRLPNPAGGCRDVSRQHAFQTCNIQKPSQDIDWKVCLLKKKKKTKFETITNVRKSEGGQVKTLNSDGSPSDRARWGRVGAPNTPGRC